MKFDITRQPLSVTVTIFILLLTLFMSRSLIMPFPAEISCFGNMPLGIFVDRLAAWNPVLYHAVSIIFIFINAVLITRISARNMLYVTRTYLPAIFYLLLGFGIFIPKGSLSTLIASFLIIKGLELYILGFKRALTFDRCFRGSFLIGSATLFIAQAAIIIPFAPLILSFFYRKSREQVISVFGLILPLAICSYIYWGVGHDFYYVIEMLWKEISVSSEINIISDQFLIPRLIVASLMILLLFISTGAFFAGAGNMRAKPYRILLALLFVMFAGVAMFLIPGFSIASFALLAIPFSLIAPVFFVRNTGMVPALIYLIVVFCVIGLNVAEIFIHI